MAFATPSIGIDLGTSNCSVATWNKETQKVEIIPNDVGAVKTPSYVAFTDKERLVGSLALNQASRNPTNTIFDAKRLIGRKFNDPIVQADMKLWPFKVIEASQRRPAIEVTYKGEKKILFAEEILAILLRYMKQIAKAFMGCNVTNAIITVPAYFNDLQREATRDAGKIAGLNVLRIINEATAAAVAYGFDNYKKQVANGNNERNVLVFDLGGGTLDVSLVSIDDGVTEVKATAGDTHLGGQDFDNILVDYFVKEFENEHKCDLKKSDRAMTRLRTQCEQAKRTLSASARANIEIDSLYDGIDFASSITRARFEDLCMHYFRNCLEPVSKVLTDAKMSKSDVDDIILVGGSTRIPKIREMIKQFFNGKEPCQSVNACEAVAYGAAIQAAILSPDKMGDADVLLIDVAPLSLGIETSGSIMTKLIERNKTIPCKAKETITTNVDNQASVSIRVFEGESKLTKDNNLLGEFELMGIPPAPRGKPQIAVLFDLDPNGILSVSAKDIKNAVNSKEITINPKKGRLSADEINEIEEKCKQYELEDEKNKKSIKAKNDLENFVFEMRNTLDDGGKFEDLIKGKNKMKVQDSVKATMDWMDEMVDADWKEYEEKKQELEDMWKPIAAQGEAAAARKKMEFEKQDRIQKEKEQARNDLEKFAFEMRNMLDDDKFKDVITGNDRKKVENAVIEVINWIDDENGNYELKQFETKKTELQDMWTRIIVDKFTWWPH